MADDVLRQVLAAAGAEEGYEIRQFRVYRGQSEILVTLKDRGFDAPTGRYSVELRKADEPPTDEPYSLGNPGRTIDEALSNAHWQEFR